MLCTHHFPSTKKLPISSFLYLAFSEASLQFSHVYLHCKMASLAFHILGGLVTKSCPTHYDSMDYSLPGSSVHGILQARILEWVAISFSRGSSQPRNAYCNINRIILYISFKNLTIMNQFIVNCHIISL